MKIEVDQDKLDILLKLARNHCIPLFKIINGEYCKDQCLHWTREGSPWGKLSP